MVSSARLRSKVEPDPRTPWYIRTVPGVGYSSIRIASRTATSPVFMDPGSVLLERPAEAASDLETL